MSTTFSPSAAASKVITFAIDEPTEQLLEKLKFALGKTSRAEVLRKAIALLEVATDAEREGGSIATLDKDGNIRHRVKLV